MKLVGTNVRLFLNRLVSRESLNQKSKSLILIFLVISFYLILQEILFDYSASTEKSIALLFFLLPVLAVWFLARILLSPSQSALLTSFVFSILSWISLEKAKQTNLPLSWNDIFIPRDVTFFFQYLEITPLLVVVLVLGVAFVASLAITKIPRFSIKQAAASSLALVLIVTATAFPFGASENQWQARNYLQPLGVEYVPQDWPINLKINGLMLHLLQTSIKPVPPSSTRAEILAFQELQNASQVSGKSMNAKTAKTVVFILCESCWYDAQNFEESFDGLREIGFRETRAISPVYGGGTVNASLELLSGLPMTSKHLGGVIYQEYADLLSPEVRNLTSSFKESGYVTVTGHNWLRKFWRRDEVKPKLGFDVFYSIEDLRRKDLEIPRDKILYDFILRKVKLGDHPTFIYLTTMFSHGPYLNQGDDGAQDFRNKLLATTEDIRAFSAELLSKDPDSLILVVADHKPALPAYFLKNGVIPKKEFEVDSLRRIYDFSPEIWGDVPALILNSDSLAVDSFVSLTNKKPFYCLGFYANSIFLGLSLPAHEFIKQQSICEKYGESSYKESVDAFPSWLFRQSLF
jgi:phosphoglycerol transferase MdoB-like AlkP superfamily enzyme